MTAAAQQFGREPLVHLRERVVAYDGVEILRDIDIALYEGERVALLGPSGAGKSTLLKLLFRHLVDAGFAPALVPQELGLVANLSAWHNIYMGRLARYGSLYNLANLVRPFATRRREIEELAAQLGLDGQLAKPAASLSGGQQQRLAIARALYGEQPVVLADEPVANLDPPTARRCLALLLERCPTAVIALHNVDQALATCARVIGIADGRILFDAPAEDVDEPMLQQLYRTEHGA